MITATNLTKKYADHLALNNLNLTVERGEIYCLLGANGAGKTTTINLLLGFIAPSSGVASIGGIDVSKDSLGSKKLLAYIPENLMLYPSLSAVENLDYFSGIAGKAFSKEDLERFLEQAGLQPEAFHKRVVAFSKGMRQKVGIAIALAKDANALLLDEPTSGLDPQASNEFGILLQELKQRGIATLMATHDLFRAMAIATHIGIMRNGELIHEFVSSDISLAELEKAYLEAMAY